MSLRILEALRGQNKSSSERHEKDSVEEANRLLEKIDERKRRRLKRHSVVIAALASKYPNPFDLLSSIEEDLARGQTVVQERRRKPLPCSSSSPSFGLILFFIFIIGGPICLILLSSYLSKKIKPNPNSEMVVDHSSLISL